MPQDIRGKREGLGSETTIELSEADILESRGTPSPTDVTAQRDRYEDVAEIGRGGMGRVNHVRDTRLRRSVAMKLLDPALSSDPRVVTRFVEEAQIQAQLDHPNVAPTHDLDVDPDGTVFFTMKLVRGTSLSDWLRSPARPPGSVGRLGEGLDVFLKVCDAVAFAHSRGVLHRDLKPSNVMLGEFGEVYVVDWGLAKTTGDSVVVSTRTPGRLADEANGLLGTPAYLSPEAARGEPCDERTDVFGLGTILYVMVTGKPVYGDVDPFEAIDAARDGAVVPPEVALGEVSVSKKLLRIVSRALAPAPADRYPNVSALAADVRQLLRAGLNMPRRTVAAGTRIVTEGEAGEEAFIIVEGTCEAYKTVGGVKKTLRQMGPGEVFGETAVLSNSVRTATVEALTSVTMFVIDRSTLEEGLGFDTWLGTLVTALARRFRELDARATTGA